MARERQNSAKVADRETVMPGAHAGFGQIGTEFVGVLLWPAVVVHAVLTVLLGLAWSKSHRIGA